MYGNNSKISQVFDQYCHNEKTKEAYSFQLARYLNHFEIDIEQLRSKNQKEIEQSIIQYVADLREQGLKPPTIKLALTSLKFYFDMNDVLLNWTKLKKLVPASIKLTGSDTWTDQDIREMIKSAGNSRNRALVYFLKSTGVRKGAIPGIRLEHIKDQDHGCKSVLVYAESKEEYTAFLDPESAQALENYFAFRTRKGEELKPESYVFTTSYNKNDPLSTRAIDEIIARIIRNIPGDSRKIQSKTRHNIQTLHGFRKWFGTKIKLNEKISYSVGERLLGHSAKLDPNYFVPHSPALFEKYLNIMSDLILDNHKKKDEQIKQLTDEKDKTIAGLQRQIDILWGAFKMMDQKPTN